MDKKYCCAHCYKGQCMKFKKHCKNEILHCNRVSTAKEISINYLNYHHHKDSDFYTHCIDYPLGNGFSLSLGDMQNGKIRIMLYDLNEPVDLEWGEKTNLGSIYTDAVGLKDIIDEILSSKKYLLNYHGGNFRYERNIS